MKKCTFFSFCGLMIISTLLFSVNSYAVEQKLDIKSNENGYIYFEYPNFQPYIKVENGIRYIAIKPITCTFSTKYSGTITFNMQSPGNSYEEKTITSNTPLQYKFSGFYPYRENRAPEVLLYNIGCNSGTDGDNCIEAKQQHLDNLIVNCY